ncbi:MAG: hypothetical protein ACFFAA_13845 [Promethearchaeota archaeon]
MFSNQPWIKVLKTAKNESKAKAIVEKLMKQGYDIVATLPPQGNSKLFRIGIFDEKPISMFDKLNQISGMNFELCKSCGKQVNENNFFKCVNCGYWECRDCGTHRLYEGQVPLLHTCGEDDFESLANIGNCANCGEPMGFRSVPQKLRAQMMGKIRVSSMQMMTLGIIGCFTAEKQFIEKEISKIFESTKLLFEKLKGQHSNPNEWLKTYKSIKSNFLRSDWSASYVLDVLDMFLSRTGRLAYEEISTKLKNLLPELRIKGSIHAYICNIICKNISKSQYDEFLANVSQFMNNPKAPYYSQKEKNAITELRALSNQIQDPNLFNKYAPLIEDLILIDDIVTMLNQYPPHLKCDK